MLRNNEYAHARDDLKPRPCIQAATKIEGKLMAAWFT
jgi:hypothetical protein